MKVRVGTLRKLIREAKVDARTNQILDNVVSSAEKYVDSVVAGSPSGKSAEELRDAAEQVASLAKWLLGKREKNSEPVARLAKTALDLADKSGFWKRPAFLNKQDYVDDVQTLLRRLQRFQADATMN